MMITKFWKQLKPRLLKGNNADLNISFYVRFHIKTIP